MQPGSPPPILRTLFVSPGTYWESAEASSTIQEVLGIGSIDFSDVIVDQRLAGHDHRIFDDQIEAGDYFTELNGWEQGRAADPQPVWIQASNGSRTLRIGDWWSLVETVGTRFEGAGKDLIEVLDWAVTVGEGRQIAFSSGTVPFHDEGQALAEKVLRDSGVNPALGYLHGIACSQVTHDRWRAGADLSAMVGRPVASCEKTPVLIDSRMADGQVDAFEVAQEWAVRCQRHSPKKYPFPDGF